MMENGKQRKRPQLSPEEKWEIFLEVTSQDENDDLHWPHPVVLTGGLRDATGR